MPNALSREADTLVCVGVRWCAWDDAEALEGDAGSGLERLIETIPRTASGTLNI